MESRTEIYEKLVSIFTDLFEIDASDITEQSLLYEDLDIDSIDAVDMIVELKKLTGKKIKPDEFKSVRSVEDVVDAVYKLMKNE